MSEFTHYYQGLLEYLDEVKRDYSEKNWDGYNALPVSDAAYNDAKKILKLLDRQNLLPGDINPEVDGGIEFEWYNYEDKSCFTISLNGNNVVGYSGLFYDGSESLGTVKLDDSIQIISSNVDRVFPDESTD